MPKTSTASAETIYFVAHNGDDIVHYGNVKPGAVVTTGQPHLEEFSAPDDAARRAFELEYTSFPVFTLEDSYEEGDYVIYSDDLYKALELIEPRVLPFGVSAAADELPFPSRALKNWELIATSDESADIAT